MRAGSRWTFAVLLAIGVLLAVRAAQIAVAVNGARRQAVPISTCPAAIGYVCSGSVHVLRHGRDTALPLRVPVGWRIQQLVGCSSKRDVWVCVIARDETGTLDQQLVAIAGGTRLIRLADNKSDPAFNDLLSVSIHKDCLVLASLAGGRVVVSVRDLEGRVKSMIRLRIPGQTVSDVGRVKLSDNGSMVAAVSLRGVSRWRVYLFGASGGVLRYLGDGGLPAITADGRRVAFVGYGNPGDHYVTVHDVFRNRTERIQVWQPARFRDAIPLLGGDYADSLYQIEWSHDGNWLLCGMLGEMSRQGTVEVGLDLRSRHTRRCYFHLPSTQDSWTVIP